MLIYIGTPNLVDRITNATQLLAFYRGRYSVELHLSFLRLQGQANDFKIQYSSVVRLFLLPKVLYLVTGFQLN